MTKKSKKIPKAPNKKFIKNNIVEDYLKQNPTMKFSIKSIKNELKLKKISIAYYYATNSKNIRKVNPLEVGSGKKNLSVFTYEVLDEIDN